MVNPKNVSRMRSSLLDANLDYFFILALPGLLQVKLYKMLRSPVQFVIMMGDVVRDVLVYNRGANISRLTHFSTFSSPRFPSQTGPWLVAGRRTDTFSRPNIFTVRSSLLPIMIERAIRRWRIVRNTSACLVSNVGIVKPCFLNHESDHARARDAQTDSFFPPKFLAGGCGCLGNIIT